MKTMQDMETSGEYVSIRQLWLQALSDCRRAIALRAHPDASWEKSEVGVGNRLITDAVMALYYSLCDYGECILKTEADQYFQDYFKLEAQRIWKSDKGIQQKYLEEAELSIKFYHHIVQLLNKYGMLFEGPPEGYSNVEMQSI